MPQTDCGFDDTPQASGAMLLSTNGPTLAVDIGFDPSYSIHGKKLPNPGLTGIPALVDTGASISCIDNIVATALNLPVVDKMTIAGTKGSHEVNLYQAQIHVPSLNTTILGRFAGVDLIVGGQKHQALIGRSFLEDFKMTYNGKTGKVTISSI